MTATTAFSNQEVALAAALAIAVESTIFLLLALSPNEARITEVPAAEKREVPMEVKPILDLPLLKKGGKRIKAKLPDMWIKKPPIKRFEARSAPSPEAKDEPLEKPIDTPLAKLDEKPPPPDAAVAKEVDEQVKQIDAGKPVEEPNVDEKGAADGVEEGTEADPLKAFAVSQYKMKISSWFNVRFKRPTKEEIPCDVLKTLRASVAAQISGQRTVQGYTITSPGNHALFDERVRATMDSIVAGQSELPPPPPNYPDILGTNINVAFFVPQCE